MGNNVAGVLRIIGYVLMVVGLILGIFINEELNEYSVNWIVIATWFGSGVVSGFLFLGLAEVIEILHEINEKLSNESEFSKNVNKEVFTRKEASNLYEAQEIVKRDN